MKVINLQKTCGGCPTVFEWNNRKGHSIYFRLRNGSARIVNETKDKELINESMDGFDGVCNWKNVVEWAQSHGLILTEV